jgi:hypothetical protein
VQCAWRTRPSPRPPSWRRCSSSPAAPACCRSSRVATDFTLADGFLSAEALELAHKDGGIVLRGRTGLDGSVDYAIDISKELARHHDSQKVLDALGGSVPAITLRGTLGAPQVALPDLAQGLLQKGVDRR